MLLSLLARLLRVTPSVSLVLSSGGARGLAHIGIIESLEENGYEIKSIAGTSPKPNRAYAVELASRGYVVIAPDYPGFGDLKDYSFDNDRYTSGTMKGIFNHIRCIDFLQSLPNVDAEKIGVIGHSLGAHNAIFVSAFDERIKITIASSGWTLFPYYDAGEKATTLYGGKLGPWTQKLYMPTIKSVYELDATKIPFDFDDVIATIAPRIFYNNSPLNDANFDVGGVKAGINNVKKIYRLFNAENNIYTRYPDDVHNFPPAIRKEAYQKIDSVFHFKSLTDTLFLSVSSSHGKIFSLVSLYFC